MKQHKSKLEVKQKMLNGKKATQIFSASFKIGRDSSCDIQLNSTIVSREHAEVFRDETHWWIRDLKSRNGVYVNNRRVKEFCIKKPCEIQLGQKGINLWMQPSTSSVSLKGKKINLEPNKKLQISHTALGAGLILVIVFIGISIFQHTKLTTLQESSADLYDAIKVLEIQVSKQELQVAASGSSKNRKKIKEKRNQLSRLKAEYDHYVDNSNVLPNTLNIEEKLIHRVARRFGEYELAMPNTFISEVKKYIKKWQRGRLRTHFEQSISQAQQEGFVPIIKEAMTRYSLPEHFFYLGLQESGFNVRAVGTPTKYGFAKGAWQFIPTTATHYGLKVGPLVSEAKYDIKDERHNFRKSTHAAARYLKYIYTTEAQASGLLVMASYNWGEHRILKLLSKMSGTPSNKTFWNLVKKHKIPKETYNYVLNIFSASVIGENPRHFGFNFDNPLTINYVKRKSS